jgi:hypothetical protein
MPRSHDEHFFSQPPLMIDGLVRPPRVELENETLFRRHVHAVLLRISPGNRPRRKEAR